MRKKRAHRRARDLAAFLEEASEHRKGSKKLVFTPEAIQGIAEMMRDARKSPARKRREREAWKRRTIRVVRSEVGRSGELAVHDPGQVRGTHWSDVFARLRGGRSRFLFTLTTERLAREEDAAPPPLDLLVHALSKEAPREELPPDPFTEMIRPGDHPLTIRDVLVAAKKWYRRWIDEALPAIRWVGGR